MRTIVHNRLLSLLAILLVFLMPINGIASDVQLELQGEWIAGTIYSHTQLILTKQSEGTLTADNCQITYEIDKDTGTINLLIAEDDDSFEKIEAAYASIGEAAHFVYTMAEKPVGYFIVQSPATEKMNELFCYEVELDTSFFFNDGEAIKDKNEKFEYSYLDDKLYIADGNEYMGGHVTTYGDDAFILDTGTTITWHEEYPPIMIWMLFVQGEIIR